MLQHFFLNWKVHIPVPSSITTHVCKEKTIVLIVEYCNDWKQSELEALHSHSSFRRILTTDNKTIALVKVWAAFFCVCNIFFFTCLRYIQSCFFHKQIFNNNSDLAEQNTSTRHYLNTQPDTIKAICYFNFSVFFR